MLQRSQQRLSHMALKSSPRCVNKVNNHSQHSSSSSSSHCFPGALRRWKASPQSTSIDNSSFCCRYDGCSSKRFVGSSTSNTTGSARDTPKGEDPLKKTTNGATTSATPTMHDRDSDATNGRNCLSVDEVLQRMNADKTFRDALMSQAATWTPSAVAASVTAPPATTPTPTKAMGEQQTSPSSEPPPSPPSSVNNEAPPPLTRKQWTQLFIRTAAPFFGFGICDNLIMITVGDLIDTHFGVTLGFSTMVAAGLGQACSDGAGITIQGSIEAFADRMGLPNPNLTEAQLAVPRLLFWRQVFRTIGIICGCLCGLIPIVCMDTGNRPRLYDQLLNCLSEEHRKALSAKATYVHHHEGETLFTYGEDADAMYMVVTGEVAVIGRSDRGDPIEFCKSGPGANLGIIELAFGHKCVADVVVTSPTVKLLRIDRRDFEQSPNFAQIREVVTRYVEEDDSFVVYRARHMIPPKAIEIPSYRSNNNSSKATANNVVVAGNTAATTAAINSATAAVIATASIGVPPPSAAAAASR